MQRNKSEIVISHELQEWTSGGGQWGWLIVMAIGSAVHPVDLRNAECRPKTRADGVLGHRARKIGGAKPCRQREPRDRFEFVIDKEGCDAACWMLRVAEPIAAVESRSQQFVIALVETVHPQLQVVLRLVRAETDLAPTVSR